MDSEQDGSGAVTGRDENRIIHDQGSGGGNGCRIARWPGLAKSNDAVLGIDGNETAHGKEEDMPSSVDGGRHGRGVAGRFALGSPHFLAGFLVKSEHASAERAGVDEQEITFEERRGADPEEIVRQLVLFRQAMAPDFLSAAKLQSV